MLIIASVVILAATVVALDRICNDKYDQEIRRINQEERDAL